jgi:hypothetical protein
MRRNPIIIIFSDNKVTTDIRKFFKVQIVDPNCLDDGYIKMYTHIKLDLFFIFLLFIKMGKKISCLKIMKFLPVLINIKEISTHIMSKSIEDFLKSERATKTW